MDYRYLRGAANPTLICSGTENLFSFSSRYHLQRPWSFWSSFRGNLWISARSLARLCRGVVYVGSIAGWPIHVETKLQIEFCSVLWPLRFRNGPCTAGRTNSNPCINYHSKSLETKPWGTVLVVPVLERSFSFGPAVGLEQTIFEPI